eukprot:700195-Rhodomonas_salina.3
MRLFVFDFGAYRVNGELYLLRSFRGTPSISDPPNTKTCPSTTFAKIKYEKPAMLRTSRLPSCYLAAT